MWPQSTSVIEDGEAQHWLFRIVVLLALQHRQKLFC
jgi:hypothetical protein